MVLDYATPAQIVNTTHNPSTRVGIEIPSTLVTRTTSWDTKLDRLEYTLQTGQYNAQIQITQVLKFSLFLCIISYSRTAVSIYLLH